MQSNCKRLFKPELGFPAYILVSFAIPVLWAPLTIKTINVPYETILR